jgi:stage V sporulation protein G
MKITNVKVRKTFENAGAVKAIVSVTFDDALAIHNIKVVEVNEKTIVAMPALKGNNGEIRDVVHPINSQLRAELTAAVLEAVQVYNTLKTAEQ